MISACGTQLCIFIPPLLAGLVIELGTWFGPDSQLALESLSYSGNVFLSFSMGEVFWFCF